MLILWLSIVFTLIVIFIVTAVSNAANLTDGIDGLAAGTSASHRGHIGYFAYVSGNTIIADYLNVFYIPNSAELVIFSACFIGACIGFLWHNSFPARVFMGDTGSLTIGGIIAVLAILLRKELLIPILCGIFVAENLICGFQVSYFKYTKRKYGEGRRIFKMSPLHHHFQKEGMHEAKIVTRFWIIGILLAIVSVIHLKDKMMKSIVIIGAGESGVGAALLAKKLGLDVFVSDNGKISEKYKKELTDCNIPFEEGGHDFEKVLVTEVVIKSPGVPEHAPVLRMLKEQRTESNFRD
jgi:hypothetical protein